MEAAMGPVSRILAAALLAGSFLLVGNVARASGIPISGDAYAFSARDYTIEIGGALTVYSTTVDAPDTFLICAAGVPCNLSYFIPSCIAFGEMLTPYCSSGSFNGRTADIIGGGLTFTAAPIDIPIGSPNQDQGYSVIVPVSVSGQIVGYPLVGTTCPPLDCELGPAVFTLNIEGTGTLDAEGTLHSSGRFVVDDLTMLFAGTATPTPEPASVLLLASGLGPIAVRLCRRRRLEEK
jgi:hypothetical protein